MLAGRRSGGRCEGAKPYGSFDGEQIVMERIRDEFNYSNK
jgi:hypothetical protein